MKRIILIILLLLMLVNTALARPLILKSTIAPDSYAVPVCVYSNDKINVYVPDDMINMNLFYTDYPTIGNFTFMVYMELINDNTRQAMIDTLNDRINKNQLHILGRAYPESLRYVAFYANFDMQNRTITNKREYYLDEDGDFIGFVEFKNKPIKLDNLPIFSKIADRIANLMEKEKNYPKNADIIAEINKNR